ncbi:NAD kinase [Leekyejoonella antrihumi]|uniref:NAD kinase n=1 Tax=Leekyejoonella antrihumi TaxID=1660198 RepID=A0A563DXA3_9MICO|nr:NAD kinase [Leekyejoonella antrihumi]TWP34890.1 NAD kinase [Leekyejoonella antrihumi]
MSRRILLVGHPGRPEALEVAAALVTDLARHDIQVAGMPEELQSFGIAEQPNVVVVDPRDPADGCELVVVLGGDGTILRGAELGRPSGVPLLGINLGHVGFLAEAERDDIHITVDKIVERSWTVEERETLEVEVSLDGRAIWSSWALNEATVEKAARERMVSVIVEIDGRPLSTWACDGVIMATPTGSTAYAFSAGGPVVWPGVAALLLVPISAHALFARPLVLGHDAQIAVGLVPHGDGGGGVLWCDGRRTTDLPPGARIDVRRSDLPVRLARLTSAPFSGRLVAKFDLSVSGWRGTNPPRLGQE